MASSFGSRLEPVSPAIAVPAQPKANSVAFSLLHHEERRVVEALCPQERLAPIQTTQSTCNPVPFVKWKRASRHTFSQALANVPRPLATKGEEARLGAPAATVAMPTLWRWCPLHETSLQDMTSYR
jgi:hypothetical protein